MSVCLGSGRPYAAPLAGTPGLWILLTAVVPA
jgi:hypothetical protein